MKVNEYFVKIHVVKLTADFIKCYDIKNDWFFIK